MRGVRANDRPPTMIAIPQQSNSPPPFLYPPGPRRPGGCSTFSLSTLAHSSRSLAIHIPFFSCRRRRLLVSSQPLPAFYQLHPLVEVLPLRGPIAAGQFSRIWLHSQSPAPRPCPCVAVQINTPILAIVDAVNTSSHVNLACIALPPALVFCI